MTHDTRHVAERELLVKSLVLLEYFAGQARVIESCSGLKKKCEGPNLQFKRHLALAVVAGWWTSKASNLFALIVEKLNLS